MPCEMRPSETHTVSAMVLHVLPVTICVPHQGIAHIDHYLIRRIHALAVRKHSYSVLLLVLIFFPLLSPKINKKFTARLYSRLAYKSRYTLFLLSPLVV